MSNIINNLLSLSRQRQMVLGGVGVGLTLLMLLGFSIVSAPDYAPIYADLSPAAASSVEANLTNSGFDTRLSDDGSSVLVPRSDLARARMVLAETGVPIEGNPGWELFDDTSGLAMNSFMQQVNRIRALEGELARSIQTLEGVQSARVHLVLPEREAFSHEKPEPRASVIIRPVPGRTIARKQAVAIRNLVASSVAELDLGRVTVLSSSGEVILAEASDGSGQVTLQSTKASIEERLAQEVRNILTARVGAGNARVRVNVELTSAREVVIQESFDPDQQVVRSTENRTEEQAGVEGGGNVGVENNIPAALTDPGASSSSNQSKTGEVVHYEIGNTRRETVREAGEIRKISVAVLVNGIYNVEGSDVTYSERDADELNRLAELVRSAVGFDGSRGDNISIDSFRFMDYSMEVGEPISLSPTQMISQNIVSILRGLLGLALVAIVIILGVRPALRFLSENADPALPLVENPLSLEGDSQGDSENGLSGETLAAQNSSVGSGYGANSDEGAPSKVSMTDIFDPELDNGPHEYIEKMGVRGNLIKARVEAIQEMAEEKPDEVLRVLRTWLREEAGA